MSKQKPTVVDRDGFRAEWFSRRTEWECNIYKIEPDGTRGALVAELGYPKISGVGINDFMPEAVSIAKRNVEKDLPQHATAP